jgi:hypothetical protein
MADEEKEQTGTEEDGGITVEVAEEKGGKPSLSDEEIGKLESVPAEDEIGKYTKDAQRRIKNLHIAGEEWRRRSRQASKDAATATSLAEQLYRENQELKLQQGRSEAALIAQAVARAEAQLAQARSKAKTAYATQDPDQMVAANEEVARFVAEADRLRLLKPAEATGGPPGAPGAEAVPAPPVPRPVSDRVRGWIEKNPWFGKAGEEEITGFALGVHQSLEKQGVTEEGDPEQYWNTINRRLKEKFPERFQAPGRTAVTSVEEPRRPVAVTAGTRTNGSAGEPLRGRRTVVLSESQVRIAKALDLTNEQYAAQLVKEEQKLEREKGRVQ